MDFKVFLGLLMADKSIDSNLSAVIYNKIYELSNLEAVVPDKVGIEYGLDVTSVVTDQTHNIKYEEDDIIAGKDAIVRQQKHLVPDKVEAMEFAEWVHDQMYRKYFGSEGENVNKWYKSYTKPDRKYYTFAELFTLWKGEKKC